MNGIIRRHYIVTNASPELIFTLPAVSGTGQEWRVQRYDSRLIRLMDSYFRPEPETCGVASAGGRQVYRFRARTSALVGLHRTRISLEHGGAEPGTSSRRAEIDVTLMWLGAVPSVSERPDDRPGAAPGHDRAHDGAGAWQLVGTGMGAAVAIAVAPGRGTFAAAPRAGLYLHGEGEWRRLSLRGHAITCVRVVPGERGDRVLVGTQHNGIYDASGKHLGLACCAVHGLSPLWGSYLYAVTSEGVYRAGESADDWRHVGLMDMGVLALGRTPCGALRAATLDKGLFGSDDDGVTWRWCGQGPGARAVCAFAAVGDVLWAATHDAGVWLSSDGGASWVPDGLIDHLVADMVAVGDALYVATQGQGVLVREAGELDWRPMSGLDGVDVNALGHDVAEGLLLAATARGVYGSRVSRAGGAGASGGAFGR